VFSAYVTVINSDSESTALIVVAPLFDTTNRATGASDARACSTTDMLLDRVESDTVIVMVDVVPVESDDAE
jgi:hypothetical protein